MPYLKFPLIVPALILSLLLSSASANAAPFDTIKRIDTVELSNFEKVYVAPVAVDLADKEVRRNIRDIHSDRPVSDRDKARKAQDAYEDIVRALGKKFEVVDTPAPDVLTVEATVTRLTSTRPTLEDYSTIIGLNFSSVYAGGADFNVRLKQGETLIADISDSYQTNFNDGRPRIGIWQDYDRVSKQFARKLARYVERN